MCRSSQLAAGRAQIVGIKQSYLAHANIEGVKGVNMRPKLKFNLRTPTCWYVGTDYHG